MNLFFRFFLHVIRALFRPKLDILGTSIVTFRVFPTDLDLNGHMNNGRYLTLMDIGRMDLVARCGSGKAAIKNRWKPMVASVMIRFRRGLSVFQKYEMHSRVIGWDARYTYLEHKIIRGGNLVSVAVVKGSFVGKNGPVPSQAVVKAVGSDILSPPLPDYVTVWQKSEEGMKEFYS